MVKHLLGLIAGCALVVTGARIASAGQFNFHAASCAPSNSTEGSKISYTANGAQNNAGTSASIDCPINLPDNPFVTEVSVNAFDRHDTANVCCGLEILSSTGAIIFTQGTTGHCTSGSGAGLKLVPSFTPNVFSGSGRLRCDIPQVHPTLGISHVVSYKVSTP